MKISVVICAYNEEKYIGPCLESLQKQTEKPYEIIVVNNNSTDKTVDRAKQYDVRIVHEKKQGIIAARNTGFDAARGDILARSDADTIIPPDWIQKIRHNFETRDIDALSGPVVFYDLPRFNMYGVKLYLTLMRFFQNNKPTMVGPNMILTKSLWHKIRHRVCLDDANVHEDIDMALQIARAGGKLFIDDTLIVQVSARRIKKNPASFFVEYPVRVFKTLVRNK